MYSPIQTGILCLTGSSRVANLISTSVLPVRLTTIAVTQLSAYNGDERLEVAYVPCARDKKC